MYLSMYVSIYQEQLISLKKTLASSFQELSLVFPDSPAKEIITKPSSLEGRNKNYFSRWLDGIRS